MIVYHGSNAAVERPDVQHSYRMAFVTQRAIDQLPVFDSRYEV